LWWTVTEHHTNEFWNLQSNVLLAREMPERHTGENPANKLKSAVAEFNLDGKVSTALSTSFKSDVNYSFLSQYIISILDFTVFREGTLLSGARILIKIKKSFVFYEF
jgi:hypothetical protein